LLQFDIHDRFKVKEILGEALDVFNSIGAVGQETQDLYQTIRAFAIRIIPANSEPQLGSMGRSDVPQTNDVMKHWREADRVVTLLGVSVVKIENRDPFVVLTLTD
jgi:hypothetical protein